MNREGVLSMVIAVHLFAVDPISGQATTGDGSIGARLRNVPRAAVLCKLRSCQGWWRREGLHPNSR